MLDRRIAHMYPGRRVGWVAVLLIHTLNSGFIPAWADEAVDDSDSLHKSVLETYGLKPDAIESRRAQLVELGGEVGVWFPMPSARKLLVDVQQAAELGVLAQKLEVRLTTEMARGKLLEDEIANREKGLLNCNNAHAACLKEVEAQKPVWWKAKSLWFTVGIIVGGGLVTGIAMAAR